MCHKHQFSDKFDKLLSFLILGKCDAKLTLLWWLLWSSNWQDPSKNKSSKKKKKIRNTVMETTILPRGRLLLGGETTELNCITHFCVFCYPIDDLLLKLACFEKWCDLLFYPQERVALNEKHRIFSDRFIFWVVYAKSWINLSFISEADETITGNYIFTSQLFTLL